MFDQKLLAKDFEVLGEKAFPEGHVYIFIKDKHPRGMSRKIVVEVKKGPARKKYLSQLLAYIQEIKEECLGGVLICSKFPSNILKQIKEIRNVPIVPLTYRFEGLEEDKNYTFKELLQMIRLENQREVR